MWQYILSMIPTEISCFWFPVKVFLAQFLIRIVFALIFEGAIAPVGLIMGWGIIFVFFGWVFIGLTYISSYFFCQYNLYRQILFIIAVLVLGFEIIDNIFDRIYKQGS